MNHSLEFRFGGFASRVDLDQEFHLPKPPESRWLAVFDKKTHTLFGRGVEDAVVLPMGERNKGWGSIRAVLRAALRRELSRRDAMIGIGGGMVCDMAAFAASVYKRGCRLILVPTTLLAMVDAAVGGKTGINLSGYKNMVGSFYPAGEIKIFISSLRSLSQREYRNGLAEVIKTALLGDQKLYDILSNRRERILSRDPELLVEVVRSCIALKGSLVEKDLREEGVRAQLNLGHTFGHALESAVGFRGWSHGEAVAWGIGKAMDLGLRLGVTEPGYADRVKRLLEGYGFRLTAGDLDAGKILGAMRKDKKRLGESLRFVLQRKLGETVVREIEDTAVLDLLAQNYLPAQEKRKRNAGRQTSL
jgi:3-dehydroquinate synthase